MEFWIVIGVILLVIFAYSFGISVGRAYEIRRRIPYDYDENMQRQFDEAKQQGYMRGKLTIPPHLTIQETALALHRIEGLAKAMTENVTDMKATIRSYGTENTRPNERTDTN